jgi:hypothetical protein
MCWIFDFTLGLIDRPSQRLGASSETGHVVTRLSHDLARTLRDLLYLFRESWLLPTDR